MGTLDDGQNDTPRDLGTLQEHVIGSVLNLEGEAMRYLAFSCALGALLAVSSTASRAADMVRPSISAEEASRLADEDEDVEEDPGPPPCFDVAVVARIGKQTPTKVAHGENEWLFRWPWKLDLQIEQVLAGKEKRRKLTVIHSMHVRYRPEVELGLMFLRRMEDGVYVVVDLELNVVKDSIGRFVIPVTGPMKLRSDSFIPSDYTERLTAFSYDQTQAWWLKKSALKTAPVCNESAIDYKMECVRPYASDEGATPDLTAYPWGRLVGDWLIADKGLLATDIAAADAKFRCPGPGGTTAGSQKPLRLTHIIEF